MKRLAQRIGLTLLVVGAACFAQVAAAQQTFSYVDLVHRMTNLERLAVLPDRGETCQQWSSFDRASQYDAATGKYVHWDANNDGPMFLREEPGGSVMAEMEGPGCIWRIWSALTGPGHVKIYLDGKEQPAVDLPFNDYFTGKAAPFNYPTLSYALEEQGCRGKNLYFPIPYQKSCMVVAEKDWGRYYHFNYTTYPKGTVVPTFKADLGPEEVAALKQVDGFFRERLGSDPAAARPGEETIRKSIVSHAGQTDSLTLDGPRAITAIRGNLRCKDRADQMAAMRRLMLKITFDGQAKPAVWCPLGDFFGTAPGINLYRSLPTGMTEKGGYAYWYMPFAKNAVVELVNEDAVDREIAVRDRPRAARRAPSTAWPISTAIGTATCFR